MGKSANLLEISVNGKIATLKSQNFQLVGGNSDYEVVFDFDAAWEGHTVKTALFTFGDKTVAKPFEGNVCEGVAVSNATLCYIGVYSGDIVTSTSASVEVALSARDIGQVPEPPTEDVYNQIITLINEKLSGGGGGGGGGVSPTIEITAIDGGHRVTITDVNGTKSFDVLDGKDGSDYVITDEDIDEISEKVQRVLYRHDIRLYNGVSIGIDDIRLTLYNSDPTDYSAKAVIDDDFVVVEFPDISKFLANIPRAPSRWDYSAILQASGTHDKESGAGDITLALGVSRSYDNDNTLNVFWWRYDYDMQIEQGVSQYMQFEEIIDTVTAIPLGNLPLLDTEVF